MCGFRSWRLEYNISRSIQLVSGLCQAAFKGGELQVEIERRKIYFDLGKTGHNRTGQCGPNH